MHGAYRELLSPSLVRLALTTTALVVVVFALIGPVGSYFTLTLPQRLAYCALCGFVGWPVGYSMSVVTLYFTRSRRPLQVAAAVAAAMLIAAVPCAAVTYTLLALFFPEYSISVGLPTLYLLVASVAVPCSFLFHYAICQRLKQAGAATATGGAAAARDAGHVDEAPAPDRRPAEAAGTPAAEVAATPEEPPAGGESSTPAASGAAPRTPFTDRLSPDADGDLVFLKSEGRYIDVHTTEGSNRVIARFADAVDQLGDVGMQVHRSYWVAHRHVTDVVKRDTHTVLILTDGREIPVSRTYLQSVRATLPT